MNRPLLLFVCKFLPSPPRSGAALRNLAIIRKLSKHYQITLAAFRNPFWPVDDFVLSKYVYEVLETTWQPKPYFRIAQNTFKGLPITINRFADPLLRQKIKDWQQKNPFHRVHVSELASAILLPEKSAIDVYDAHNIEADLWEQAEASSPLLLNCLWKLESTNIARFEQIIIRKAKKITCVSKEDRQKISNDFVDKPILTLPNGVNIHIHKENILSKSNFSNFNLLFVGQTGWHANDCSLRWFIQTVWPKIKQSFCKAKFTIVGGQAKKGLNRLVQCHENIFLHENVDSIDFYFQQSSVAVAPLLYGGGTSLKILEYAAYKLPIVCTSAAIRGLPFDSKSIWICDGADGFVNSLKEIWSDSNRKAQKINHCYEIVKNFYCWDFTLKQLIGNDENSFAHPFST